MTTITVFLAEFCLRAAAQHGTSCLALMRTRCRQHPLFSEADRPLALPYSNSKERQPLYKLREGCAMVRPVPTHAIHLLHWAMAELDVPLDYCADALLRASALLLPPGARPPWGSLALPVW